MRKTANLVRPLLLAISLLSAGTVFAADAAAPAGTTSPPAPAVADSPAAAKIRALKGKVWTRGDGGSMRQLHNGDEVYSGSQIVTGKKSHVTLRFSDESVFSLGPNSQMAIDRYAYGKDPEKSSLTTRIIKGAFRFVSGLIAKGRPENMSVQLGPVATIGIRGTHVAGVVNERRGEGDKAEEASARVMLMEPEEGDKPSAIIVSNEYGSVVVDQPGYGTEIPDEHSPPSPVRKMQIRTINNLMRAIRSAAPRSMPKVRVP